MLIIVKLVAKEILLRSVLTKILDMKIWEGLSNWVMNELIKKTVGLNFILII